MNANEIKKLDEETLEKLTEGIGPSDECLCSILTPQDTEKKGLRQSIKKAFASLGQIRPGTGKSAQKRGNQRNKGQLDTVVELPLTFTQGGKGVFTTKEVVKGDPNCGKCGCANENIVLKHSFANIRISSPDLSSLCPCPSDCLPEKAKLLNNIEVTIERLAIDTPRVLASEVGADSDRVSLDFSVLSEHSENSEEN